MTSLSFSFFAGAAIAVVIAAHVQASQLRSHYKYNKKNSRVLFRRQPADRRLLQGGYIFVVSSAKSTDGTEWCMDAMEGTWVDEDGTNPNMGLRPCAIREVPSEQLFQPGRFPEDSGNTLYSSFKGSFCMLLDSSDPPEDGDRVRLGTCVEDDGFVYTLTVNGVEGYIKVASNPDLCVTFEGNNPEDDDRLIVSTCEEEDKFRWSFRSGWYIMSNYGFVRVRNDELYERNRIVSEGCEGFGSHWRLDSDGLFHSRLDDSYCMRANERVEGAPIRLARCDAEDPNQQWEWPAGFEAAVTLKGTDLNLVQQGNTPEVGDNMVLGTDYLEYSGDPVHV